ncbi:unnamed protein product [Gadus morhua 'NCC']
MGSSRQPKLRRNEARDGLEEVEEEEEERKKGGLAGLHAEPTLNPLGPEAQSSSLLEEAGPGPDRHLPPLLGSPDGEEANIYGKLKRTKRAAGPAGCATWLGAPGRLSLAEVTPSTARTTAQHLVPSLASDCATPSRFLEHRHRAEFHPH